MQSKNFVPALLVGLLMLVLSAPALAQTARGRRDTALMSTVQLRVKTRFGTERRCTGYLYSTQGLIVTTFHAIADAAEIKVVHSELGVMDVNRVRRIDPRTDVAIVSIGQQLNPAMELAQLGDSRNMAVGDKLRVLHHAEFSRDVVHESQISAMGFSPQLPQSEFTRNYAPEMLLFETTGPYDAGSAGGVVVDESWTVVGLLLGGAPQSSGQRSGYVLSSTYLAPLLATSYDVNWSNLRTSSLSDADNFDSYFGPGAQRLDFQAPMSKGCIAWFAPMYKANYGDYEFTTEINDKYSKNWFHTTRLAVDGKPLLETSASQLIVWEATTNSWGLRDGLDRYMHFDADSIFMRRVYRNREIEERIMTRSLFALAVAPGKHLLQYENRGANYKSSGIKRRNIQSVAGRVELLDIQGLSLVQMDRLPPPPPGVGEKNPVKYELTRRPLVEKDILHGIRSNWHTNQI